jgi:soluble lytic murein transglycosylase
MRARPIWGNGEAREFGVWLATWAEHSYLPVEQAAVRQELVSQMSFVRADHFRALHMESYAAKEFSLLEDAVAGDPTQLSMLCDYYRRRGLHERSIRVAERILRMSPAEGMSDVPLYLRKRICPMHFDEFVEVECMNRGVDPNTFYSLMRQESLFEPEAVSWVGARGLSQIMPSTGRWIARRLGHSRFRLGHLMDPSVNVQFGVYYLSEQLAEFDGDVMRALAAYNGGPENVKRWWNYGGREDTDVFVEDIGYAETADYVRRVYLYKQFYDEIYGRAGH